MTDEKRRVPDGSREEAQITESLLTGVLWGLVMANEAIIAGPFKYLGCEIVPAGEPEGSAVVYRSLVVRMGSGDYEVTVKQIRSNA